MLDNDFLLLDQTIVFKPYENFTFYAHSNELYQPASST